MTSRATDRNLESGIGNAHGGDLFPTVMRNGATTAAARFLSVLAAIVLVPVVIHKLGISGYGIWETLFAVASLVTMILSALGTTFLWKISQVDGRDTIASIRLVKSGIFLVLAIAVAAGGILVLLIPFFTSGLRLDAEEGTNVREIFSLLIIVSLLGGMNIIRAAALQAFHQAGLVSFVNTLSQLVNYGLAALLLYRGLGLWSLFWGVVAASVITYALHTLLLYRTLGALCIIPVRPDWRELHGMAGYFGMLLIGTGAVALRGQTDRLVFAVFASPTWVGFYGIADRLSSPIREISNFVYIPLIAASGNLSRAANWRAIGELYQRMMKFTCIVVGLTAVLLIGLQRDIQIIWLGEYIPEVGGMLVWLLLGQVTAVMLTGPGTAILKGVGRLGIETTYIVVNLVLNVIGTIVLVWLVGPMGTVIASGTTWAVASLLFVFLLHRHTTLPVRATLAGITIFVAAVLFCVGALCIRSLSSCDTRSQCVCHFAIVGGILALGFIGISYVAANYIQSKVVSHTA